MTPHAREVNDLTASWLARASRTGVLSGAGLWPLLAVLAASADEPGRSELARAARVSPDEAMDAARDVLDVLDGLDGVDAALGLWAQQAAQVSPHWRDRLPPGTFGELTGDPAADQPVLDRWAVERTRGLVERFPVQAGPELMLTLATALTLRTTWTRKFTDEPLRPGDGPWGGRELAGLSRSTTDLDDLRAVSTSAGPLTMTRVAGDNGLDVHLVLGEPGRESSDVMPAAVAAVTAPVESGNTAHDGSKLLAGGDVDGWPGLSIVQATKACLQLNTVRFTLRSDHDLLEQAATFGLETVSRDDRDHFPEIGPVPLRVDQAKQSAVAIFSATGFEAAAVTAIGLRAVSMPSYNARALRVTYDRPFGFVAVHRDSGLVLFAGWVDIPAIWEPPKS